MSRFPFVYHDNNDVRYGKTRTRPPWSTLEDQILFQAVRDRMANNIRLDASSIFVEIFASYPDWQRSELAIKTRMGMHATAVRDELAAATDAKVRRKSDQRMLEMEQEYERILKESYEASKQEKAELVASLKLLELENAQLGKEKDDLYNRLHSSEEDMKSAEIRAQEAETQNYKLQGRADKMTKLTRLMAEMFADPEAIDKVDVKKISFISTDEPPALKDEIPPAEDKPIGIPSIPITQVSGQKADT